MKRRSFFQAATALFAAVALPFREVAARVFKKFAPDTAWTHIKPEALTAPPIERWTEKFAPDTAWTHIKPEALTAPPIERWTDGKVFRSGGSVFRVAIMKNPAVRGSTTLRMQKPYPEVIPEQSQIVSVSDNTATVGPEKEYSRERYSTEKQEGFVSWDEDLAKLAKDKQA